MISVCIATHNGGKYIKEQLESILCQLGSQDEVIISDDGSTDNTINIIENLKDKRISIYNYEQPNKSQHPHVYVCRNFENALTHAKGDCIFLSDQDDFWLPDKAAICIEKLKDYTLVVHQAKRCDSILKPSGELIYKDEFSFKNYFSLKPGKYYGCTLAFRKELLTKILPFPMRLVLHDHWIGCMAELTGSVYYERTPLIKYRLHENNTSGGMISKNSFVFKVQYRCYMFLKLMIRSLRCHFKG